MSFRIDCGCRFVSFQTFPVAVDLYGTHRSAAAPPRARLAGVLRGAELLADGRQEVLVLRGRTRAEVQVGVPPTASRPSGAEL